jgi:hypothetical protein
MLWLSRSFVSSIENSLGEVKKLSLKALSSSCEVVLALSIFTSGGAFLSPPSSLLETTQNLKDLASVITVTHFFQSQHNSIPTRLGATAALGGPTYCFVEDLSQATQNYKRCRQLTRSLKHWLKANLCFEIKHPNPWGLTKTTKVTDI